MKAQPKLQMLFSPISIGGVTIKNRIVMPPMGTGLADRQGYVTDKTIAYYEARARGGAGLIIVEVTCVDYPRGQGIACQLAISKDDFIPGLSQLAKAIKSHGARAAIQLHHAGRAAQKAITGMQPVAPSSIPMPETPFGEHVDGDMPHELTPGEIAELVGCFAQAARRAKSAGFDGVELHAGAGYLIAQFLSRVANKRTDQYGGDVNNRTRFLVEIIKAIKEDVGKSFPVWPRLNGTEYGIEDGVTLEEAQQMAKIAQGAGADAIHVRSFAWGFDHRSLPPMSVPSGNMLRLAEGIKKVVTVPVIAVGRIDPYLGEKVLREGCADLIAVGRGLIADPQLPQKAAEGRFDDIVPCIACTNCHSRIWSVEGLGLRCLVNPAAGQELEGQITLASKVKKVLVVGSGPAGMEAAVVAARRGHKVTLWEKEDKLGGLLNVANKPPHKSGIEALRQYLTSQIKKMDVKVELNKEATTALIRAFKANAVIVATGSTPIAPQIPGIHNKNVVNAEAVLAERIEVGPRVVIIGGGVVGCETAEFLADKGKEVVVVDRLGKDEIIRGIPIQVGLLLLSRLAAKGVRLLTSTMVEEVSNIGLVVTIDGKRQTLNADTIVLATGRQPSSGSLCENNIAETYMAGDCVEAKDILAAIHDSFQIARLV